MPERSLSKSIAVSFCLVALTACRRGETEQAVLTAPSAPLAPDQIASNEVAESSSELFGLALPVGMRVTERMQYQAKAIGNVPFERVANYVRDRVEAKNVETGPSSTVFEAAKVKKPRTPADGKPYPDMIMRVVVKRNASQTEVGVWADEVVPENAPYVEQPPLPDETAPRPPDSAQ